jgi:hypothetical protein
MSENKFFKKAVKAKSKLRLGIFGAAGSGKTMSALRIAKGLAGKNGKIALIDTEAGSAAKYSDRYEFYIAVLDNANIDNIIELLESAALEYHVIIIDSITHAWQELIAEVEKLARAKYSNNTFSAWSEGTPKQKRMIKAFLSSPAHIILTMRSKTEYDLQKDNNGKSRPVRVGLAPETGKGMEYEVDMLLQISTEHAAEVLKDRTGKFQDQIIEKPDEKFGEQLAAWLNEGADVRTESADVALEQAKKTDAEEKRALMALPDDVKKFFSENKMTTKTIKEDFGRPAEWNVEKMRELIEDWQFAHSQKPAEGAPAAQPAN